MYNTFFTHIISLALCLARMASEPLTPKSHEIPLRLPATSSDPPFRKPCNNNCLGDVWTAGLMKLLEFEISATSQSMKDPASILRSITSLSLWSLRCGFQGAIIPAILISGISVQKVATDFGT